MEKSPTDIGQTQARASILVIVPTLFGYESRICAEMERQGARVDMLLDRHFESSLLKAATRLEPRLTRRISETYFLAQMERLARRTYDRIVVIQGESVSVNTVQRLRRCFPTARILYYTWDSLANKPHAWRNLDLYDHCITFDPQDAARLGMEFRPLFFCQDFEKVRTAVFGSDVSFIGTVHGDRYAVVRRFLSAITPGTRVLTHLYIQAPWVYWARRTMTQTVAGSRQTEFSYKALDFKAVTSIMLSTASVLDIESSRQRGLTLRTLESLGSRTKLLTTNAAIRDYDFYDPQNICVIDRLRPRIPAGFLHTPYRPCSAEIYKKTPTQRMGQRDLQ